MKKILALLLSMAMVIAMVGCGDTGSSSANTTQASEGTEATSGEDISSVPLRIDVVSTGTQAIPPYVIKKLDLAKKHGIDLQIHDNSGAWGSEWTAMKTGEVDCIITAWTYSVMNYQDKETVCVAPMFAWGNSVISGADSGITSLADLTNIKLGVYQTTALDWVLLCAAAQKEYGFSPADTCEISEAAASLLGGMLQQGNIDAALSYADTNVILGAEDGYNVIFGTGECLDILGLNKETPFLFYTFSKEYYEAHPAVVKAFTEMYEEAYDILMSDDDIWNDIASECFGVTNPNAIPALRDTIRGCILRENSAETEGQCKDMLKWCLDNGYGDLIGISEIPEGLILP
ncbi:MAG: ABC transporter substrate-binding protein [Lachnospiraceae bacterium]|nr:ABC transporter substrate-binding protein [Lachnospiraceae bacterium]